MPKLPPLTLSPMQRTALAHPCYAAEECADRRFAHQQPEGLILLTVNAGFE